jgi:dihydropyrimidine dehydrogenase (NAD+) subunit PreA
MANLSIEFCGIKSSNPFWLASGPATNSAYQVHKAFESGWGGVVWKTIGEPVMNTVNRYGGLDGPKQKLIGLNNIELISDRNIETNLKEITEIKKEWPDRALIVSLMVESKKETWHDIVKRAEDTGCDGIELNYGCPHGMSERGMGSAVGQVPEYCTMITEWVKEVSSIPVIVKLTPNVSNIVPPARAAVKGGADALSLINTVNSIIGVDLDTFEIIPSVRGKGTHGGFAGPAVKPIALHMVSEVCRDEEIGVPVSGTGGISTWQDAAEFMLLGATTIQVCTGVMHYGFRIVEDMIDGMCNWLDEKGFSSINEIIGVSLKGITDFGELDLLYTTVSCIDKEKCISCNLCYIACEDAAHQCIELKPYNGTTRPEVRKEDCVGCRLCAMICPVEGCISMVEVERKGSITWKELEKELPQPISWKELREFQKRYGIRIH